MNDQQSAVPVWFWIVAVLGLVWNLLGLAAYYVDFSMTPETIAGLSERMQEMYANRPAWAPAATGVAVLAGALGCVSLLLRRKFASVLFIISLVALVLQDVYLFAIAKVQEFASPNPFVMQGLVFIIAIFLLWFAKSSTAKGWLR